MSFLGKWKVILITSSLFLGCTPKERDVGVRLNTTPLSGIVEVDGEPAVGLTVACYPEPGSEIKFPVLANTEADGKFSIGLYKAGGGLPAGKYKLAFTWEEFGIVKKDKLNGAYADSNKSTINVTVEDGEPNDLGVIELSTKGPGK